MNTKTTLSKGSWIQLNQSQAARTGILLLLLLLLLTLPTVVQAQFNYQVAYGGIMITGYYGPGGDVTIPGMIDGLPVGYIGSAAFFNQYSLTSVTIPSSVIFIGDSAFNGCTNLTSVAIPNSVTRIGFDAFSGCSSLPSITLPNSVTNIEAAAFCGCTSFTSVTIPDSVTKLGDGAFSECTSLTAITVATTNSAFSSVEGVLFNKSQIILMQCPGAKAGSYTIPDGVTHIELSAFGGCASLTNVTIPNSVTNIDNFAFYHSSLTSVTIGSGIASINHAAFLGCFSLTALHFRGNAPSLIGSSVFAGITNATVYYLAGTTGWGATFGGLPTALWNPPAIQATPQTQTAEAGSAVGLRVKASGAPPLFCLWYVNYTNLISSSTNRELELTSVQFSQSGAYTVVVSNAVGAVTSAPALLNVIAAVEHRPVPGVKVTGEVASLLNVDYADSLSPAPNWIALSSVNLTSTSQYCFDLTLPLPPQRFYRAWQMGTPSVRPSLDLHIVPAITLTGSVGNSVRLDFINQFGPIDAWVTLATVTLTNTSQLYFDISAPGQPQRLYRLVPLP